MLKGCIMFSVYVNVERDYRYADLVKFTLIVYRTGNNGVPKLLLLTGWYS